MEKPDIQLGTKPVDDVRQTGLDQDQGDAQSCWICLGDSEDGALESFCSCPNRKVHGKCLARWCLQSAGRE